MNCQRAQALLSDHLEGLLQSRDAHQLTAHLACCSRCRRLREEMAVASAALRDLAAPPSAGNLRSRALSAWAEEQKGQTAHPGFRFARGLAPLSLAGAFTVAAASLLLVRPDDSAQERLSSISPGWSGQASERTGAGQALTPGPSPKSGRGENAVRHAGLKYANLGR
jgi:anti-sigma factor RsiW